jgi:hypothetical protein
VVLEEPLEQEVLVGYMVVAVVPVMMILKEVVQLAPKV